MGGGEGSVADDAGGVGVVVAGGLEAAGEVVAGWLEKGALDVGSVDDDAEAEPLVLGKFDGFDDDFDGEVVACFSGAGGVGRAEERGKFGDVGNLFG